MALRKEFIMSQDDEDFTFEDLVKFHLLYLYSVILKSIHLKN